MSEEVKRNKEVTVPTCPTCGVIVTHCTCKDNELKKGAPCAKFAANLRQTYDNTANQGF